MPPFVQSIIRFYQSSIGKKIIVAVTGAMLVLFVIMHMVGNLLIFAGPETLNAYAKKLADMGPLLWVARLGLLATVGLHIAATLQLTIENKAARPQDYGRKEYRKASSSSRTMIWSGVIVLVFVIYHLCHYTWGVANGYYDKDNARYWLADGSHNVYNMVVDGFNWPVASLFYIVGMALLFRHLGHGIASVFQTLGLTTPKSRPLVQLVGNGIALALFLGNSFMPIAVMAGWVK